MKGSKAPRSMSFFAFAAAALLVLVGSSAAVPEPLAVNPPTPTTMAQSEGADGGSGLVSTAVFGGELPGSPPGLLVLLEITATENSVTLTAIVESIDTAALGSVTFTAITEYYAYDALGNVRVVISSSGARLNTLAYVPFGTCAYGCGSEPRYAYTGEYRESAPNLVYLHSRWYDPTLGRFLSPDDRLGRLSAPQTQNRYAYVVNNPMK